MTELPFDPYTGAHRAFYLVYPNATEEDWDIWATQNVTDEAGQCDNYRAFAELCREAVGPSKREVRAISEEIAAALGYFESRAGIVEALIATQLASSSVPAHFKRYKEQAFPPNALSQFDD